MIKLRGRVAGRRRGADEAGRAGVLRVLRHHGQNYQEEPEDAEGQEVPADTEVRFVPSDEALAEGTHTTQIGTFDDNASVDDWGTEVDPYTREFSDGDLTVTVQSNDDPLGAWNGNTHIGHGLGRLL